MEKTAFKKYLKQKASKIGSALKEVFDPRATLRLKKEQKGFLKNLVEKEGLQGDGLDAGIRTINNPKKRRDNSLLKAIGHKLRKSQDKLGSLKNKRKAISREELPSGLIDQLSMSRDKLIKIKELKLKFSDEISGLQKEIKLGGPGQINLENKLDKAKGYLNSLNRGSQVTDIGKSKLDNKIRKFQDSSARDFASKRKEVDALLNPMEESVSRLKNEMNFSLDDASDSSILGQIARRQDHLNTIGKRQLIASGLGAGSFSAAMNLQKDSAVNLRLKRYLGGA